MRQTQRHSELYHEKREQFMFIESGVVRVEGEGREGAEGSVCCCADRII